MNICFEGGDGVKNPKLFRDKNDVAYIDLTLSKCTGSNGIGIIRFFDETMNCWLYLSDAVKLGFVDETIPMYKIVMSNNPMRKTSRSEGFYLTGRSVWTGDSSWNQQAPNYTGQENLELIENRIDSNNLLLEIYANSTESTGWGVYYQYFLPLIYHEDELEKSSLNYQLSNINMRGNNFIKYRLYAEDHNISEIQVLAGTSYESRFVKSINLKVDLYNFNEKIIKTIDQTYTATKWTDRWSIKLKED